MSIDVFNPPLRSLASDSFGRRRVHLLAEIQLRRSPRFTDRRVRRSTLVAALAIAGLVATAAYAVAERVIVGSAAPANIKHSEHRLANPFRDLLIPLPFQLHNRGMEVDKTTAAAVATGPVGAAYLWVAPNRLGGYCAYLQIVALDQPGGRPNLSGGCYRKPVWVDTQSVRVRSVFIGVLEAHAALTGARTVDVRLSDGSSRAYTITNGFVLAFVKPDVTVTSAVVEDAHGHALNSGKPNGTVSSGVVRHARRLAAATSHASRQPLTIAQRLEEQRKAARSPVVARLREIGSQLVLIERGNADRTCELLSIPEHSIGSIGGQPPRPRTVTVNWGGCDQNPLPPTALNVGGGQYAGPSNPILVLSGVVGTDIHSIELLFQDGSHAGIPLHQGYVLYQVNPRNYASGHQPTTIIARNANGKTVKTRPFWR